VRQGADAPCTPEEPRALGRLWWAARARGKSSATRRALARRLALRGLVAIYHLTVKCMSRSRGQSATAAAAYRSASRIRDERTGELHDYSRKAGVLHRELVVPQGAPSWARQRERLWNAAEVAERRRNSTVAREFEIALPSELAPKERAALAVDFARAIAAKHHCAVDVSVHRPGRGGDTRNHHAHLLCTTRRLTLEGFKDKTRELDDAKTGEVTYWRERWAVLANERLKERGLTIRVDHRTLEAQGIERVPTVHKGPLLTNLERRGIPARVLLRLEEERAQEVQARLTRAAELGRLQRERASIDQSILVLSTDIAAARRERDRALEVERRAPEPQRTPTAEKRSELEQWRDDARRSREAAKEKTKGRAPTRDRSKDRDGPDYER
jgi:ATP-dependent exoDNAse (exonuclease V) alpha subunit